MCVFVWDGLVLECVPPAGAMTELRDSLRDLHILTYRQSRLKKTAKVSKRTENCSNEPRVK